MPEVSTVLPVPVEPGGHVDLGPVAGLRYGEIVEGSAAVTVNGTPQPSATFAVDLLKELVHVRNEGASPWAQGATLLVVWSGSLSSGPPGGGGGDTSGIEAEIEALNVRVDRHDWQLIDHEARINNVTNHANSNAENIISLSQRTQSLEAEDTKIWAQFQTAADIVSTDMGVLEDKDVFHQEQLDAHAVRIDGHEIRITTLEGQVDPALAGRVVALEGEVAGLKDEDASHNETLTDHETRIETLEAAPPTGGEGTGGGLPLTGGTLTGPLVLKGSDVDSFALTIDTPLAADGCSILGRSANVNKWEISLGGPDADANFAISRYPMWEAEFPQDSPLVIYRATGFIKLIIPERADSAAAGEAGVPVGGLYQTNGL